MRRKVTGAAVAVGAMACALLAADQANAACVSSGGIITCDASAPNPERNGVFGANITLLGGTVIRQDDPYASASLLLQTVTVQPGGSLTAQSGSQVFDTAVGGTAVATGAGSSVSEAGRITARQANAVGVLLGGNSSITVAQGGIVETLSDGSSFLLANASAGIAAAGNGTTMQIDGTVQTFGNNAAAIRPYATDLFGGQFYTSAITVGATGAVTTGGANAPAISIAGGSSMSVAGRVSASGTSSNAILYQAGSGSGVTIAVLGGGSVQASRGPAITGTGADVDLTIAGRVAGASASQPAIALGSGNDRVTLFTGGAVVGTIDAGTGNNGLVLTGNGAGSVGGTANFQTLSVSSGSWTASGTQSYATSATIGAGATLSGSVTTPSYTVAAGGTLTSGGTTISSSGPTLAIDNSGTIQSTGDTARAINVSGSAGTRTITLTNQAGGLVQSADDAFRINTDLTGGSVTVVNAGTIRTTNGGQALDFDAITSGGATVSISNLAGGVIQSYGQDAIRSGQGAVIDNAGTIYSDGALGSNYDGIDMQAHTATVVNEETGVISGLRHGITTDTDLTVTNFGTITGRNGSGVGSDGNGTVINFGTITGAYNGTSPNGDGDGVDIDHIGTVANYGVIQGTGAAGVDSGGNPNTSEGITLGGGTIANGAGAQVTGLDNGIIVDNGSAGAATTITNAGTIAGTNGFGIALFGSYDDLIVNSGTISGGNGVAISMGGGNDQLTLLSGSKINGLVDGGDGYDQITLVGDPNANDSFGSAVNFERLEVALGNWTLTGASTFSDGTLIDGAATLTGTAGVLTGSITDNGTLVVGQPTDGTFTAALGGTGVLRKTGAGTLLIGTQAFTGRTDIAAGTLQLAGTLPSAVTVERGARLAGTGQIASAVINAGGTVAPGAGTLAVTGNFVQQAGSTYAATILPDAASSRIVVGGTATIGSDATLSVTRGAGTYAIGTRYSLLTAAGGINGRYDIAQTAVNGTELRFGTSGNTLFADLVRTGASLASLAVNADQASVASAVSGLGAGNAAYAALTLNPDDAEVRTALSRLDGEVHASARTAMVHDALLVEKTVAARFDTPVSEAKGLWGQLLVNGGQDEGAAGGSNTHRNTLGGVGGFDTSLGGGLRIGVAGGYTRTRDHVDATSDRARIGTWHLLGYAGGRIGGIDARAGIGYGWGRVDTRRSVSFTGFGDADRARYDANTLHGFGEIGVPVPVGGGSVEPFAGGAVIRVHNDAFAETGGATALQGRARNATVEFSDVGLRARTPVAVNLSVVASVAWQHAFDTVRPDAMLAFAGSATPFSVIGARLSRDAATPTATLAWEPQAGLRMTLTYAGEIGDAGTDSAARIGLTLGF